MFGFLKNILHRSNSGVPENNGDQIQESPSAAAPTQTYQQPRSAPRPQSVPQNGKFIDVPVQSILEGLPLELQPRVRQMDVGPMTVSVPLEKVLAQLSRGVVKVSFGELRQAVPGVFSSENDRDRVMVALPLSEILGRLNPALITRRRTQQQVEVPADIANPFDPNSGANCFSYAGSTEEPESAPQPLSHRTVKPEPHAPTPSNRGTMGPIPPPTLPPSPAPRLGAAPATTAPAHPFVPPAAPVTQPSSPVLPVTPPRVTRPAPAAQQPPPAPPIKMRAAPVPPAPMPPPAADIAPGQAAHAPARPPAAPALRVVRETPPIQATPAAPVPPPAAAPTVPRTTPPVAVPAPVRPPAAPQAPVVVQAEAPVQPPAPAKPAAPPVVLPLASLADAWPEPVRQEIVQLNLVDAQVALPATGVEQGLKQGRIVFTWKSVRAWLKPAVPATASPHDGTALELPLKVVAPAFLTRKKETKPQEKVAVDEDIPNLFFGFPQPESAPAVTTARPADTNFYVWGDSSDTVMLHESEVKRGTTPGTKFVAKYATPNEVVSRAAGLDGVAGALIALPDGLMVANQLPPELNGDTLAAFLPQIFGKVSQCTKELRMGELNNLNFTVGNVPWKIFRVNAIFFAAFGRAGEPLPTAQLAALAAELDHKPK